MTDLDPDPTLLESLARTVAQLTATTPADLAAVHLAQLLAREIDEAAAVERFAAKTLRQVEDDEDSDENLIESVRALRAKLGQREALDRLGARLASLLVELGATPKARGRTVGAAPVAGGGKLTAYRGGA